MSPRLNSVFKTAALFLVACVAAGLLGELLVRIISPQPILPRHVKDAAYGIRANIPSITYQHTSPDYCVTFTINSQGMRSDRDYAVPKPPGTVRIIGLGDSFTMGYEVEHEDTYLSVLEHILHERGLRNVEVLNMAVSGFGTAEELLQLEHEGLRYEPDVVVLGYFVNDVENNLTSNLFGLEGDTLRRADSSYLPAMGTRKFLESFAVYQYLADHSHFLNLFRNLGSYYVTQNLFKEKQKEHLDHSQENSPRYEDLLTARLLDSLARFCKRREIPLVVFNIPNYERDSVRIVSNIPLGLMRERNSISLVDATPIVRSAIGKREIHWKWQGHWRPWVHHDAGQMLADSIEGLLRTRQLAHKQAGGLP